MDQSDRQIILNIKEHKDGSFEELVHRYTGNIFNFIYRYTHDKDSSEDITQETFIKIWKNISKYNPEYSLRSWIFTIARNTTLDYLRKKKNITFSQLTTDKDLPFEDSIQSEDLLLDEVFGKLEDENVLNNTLKLLPEEYQTVVLLHYQQDMTFEEIGMVMNKPLNTVKSWHRRAVLRLRELLN